MVVCGGSPFSHIQAEVCKTHHCMNLQYLDVPDLEMIPCNLVAIRCHHGVLLINGPVVPTKIYCCTISSPPPQIISNQGVGGHQINYQISPKGGNQ